MGPAPQRHPAAAGHALTLAEVLVGAGGCRLRMNWVGEVQNRSHEASWDAGHEMLSSVHEAVPLASISNAGVELCGTAPPCRGLAGAALSLWDLRCQVGRVFSLRAQRGSVLAADTQCSLPLPELRRSSAARLALLEGASGTLAATKCGRVPCSGSLVIDLDHNYLY